MQTCDVERTEQVVSKHWVFALIYGFCKKKKCFSEYYRRLFQSKLLLQHVFIKFFLFSFTIINCFFYRKTITLCP